MTIAGGDPLGLFRRERVLPQTLPFTVFPCTVPLDRFEMPTGYLPGGQLVRRRAEYATTNIRGVRGYQPGDAFNRIHWRTTARRGRLYTKEFELDPLADFWILVDLDRQVHVGTAAEDVGDEAGLAWMQDEAPLIDPTTEEYAVTIAASVARHVLDAGKSVGLIAHGQRRLVVSPDRGDRQLAKILGGLAVVRAVGRAALAEVLSAENHEFTRHTTLIVVTPTTAQRWVDGLVELRHRGVASLVVLIEANTFGPAGAADGLRALLAAQGVPTRTVSCGDDLSRALAGSARTSASTAPTPYWSAGRVR